MEVGKALRLLCNRSTSFSLYADYLAGMSISELASESSRSEEWVRERIESARLCLERQVRIEATQAPVELASPNPQNSAVLFHRG
jgi:hypothetical protein